MREKKELLELAELDSLEEIQVLVIFAPCPPLQPAPNLIWEDWEIHSEFHKEKHITSLQSTTVAALEAYTLGRWQDHNL